MQVGKGTCLSLHVCQQSALRNQCSILQKVTRAYLGMEKTAILCSMLKPNLLFAENQKVHFSQKSDPWIQGVMKAMILPSGLNLFAFLNCYMYQIYIHPHHPETIEIIAYELIAWNWLNFQKAVKSNVLDHKVLL